ncbi:hypothetical protein E2C05_31420, partial [Paracraurococcus ruber]|uniref:hypothetical protein n=1 Tax=Paracraurococcus ruber TaxID=77675 RepID=UPI0010582117
MIGFLLLALPAAADRIPARVGDHADHGRIVFDWPAPPAYTMDQQGDRVLLRFPPGQEFVLPRRLPRNLLAAEATAEGVVLTLRPGARARTLRLGNRVVVNVFDPP